MLLLPVLPAHVQVVPRAVSSTPSEFVFDFFSLGQYALEILVMDVGCLVVPHHMVYGQHVLVVPLVPLQASCG